MWPNEWQPSMQEHATCLCVFQEISHLIMSIYTHISNNIHSLCLITKTFKSLHIQRCNISINYQHGIPENITKLNMCGLFSLYQSINCFFRRSDQTTYLLVMKYTIEYKPKFLNNFNNSSFRILHLTFYHETTLCQFCSLNKAILQRSSRLCNWSSHWCLVQLLSHLLPVCWPGFWKLVITVGLSVWHHGKDFF